jgi:hypothetical protein
VSDSTIDQANHERRALSWFQLTDAEQDFDAVSCWRCAFFHYTAPKRTERVIGECRIRPPVFRGEDEPNCFPPVWSDAFCGEFVVSGPLIADPFK